MEYHHSKMRLTAIKIRSENKGHKHLKLLMVFVFLAIGFTAAGQTSPKKSNIWFRVDTLFTEKDKRQNPLSDQSYNFIYNELEYTDSLGNGIVIQNSFPKGGLRYTLPDGKSFPYAIFWYRIINKTAVQLEVKINFPADSFPSPGSYLKLFLLPDTVTSEKLPLFNYGITGLESFLNNSFYKPTGFRRTVHPGEVCAFYIAVLSSQPGGTVRTGLVLKEQDLFYRVTGITPELDATLIPCGQIVFKKSSL